MIKKLKRLYELSKKDPEALRVLENLTEEQLAIVPDEGDGKAVFFSEPSEEDYKEFKKEEEGMKPWYDLLKRL